MVFTGQHKELKVPPYECFLACLKIIPEARITTIEDTQNMELRCKDTIEKSSSLTLLVFRYSHPRPTEQSPTSNLLNPLTN